MDKLKELWNHERYHIVAFVLVAMLLIFFYGCPSSVVSLQDPAKKISRQELQLEVDTFLATAEIRYRQLDQQDQLKRQLLDYAVLFAEGGTINPAGAILAIAALLGIGAEVDNIRKRKVIKSSLTSHPVETPTNA